MSFPNIMPNNPYEKWLMDTKKEILMTFINLRFKADQTQFIVKEVKKEKKDYRAIVAQLRRENPRLYPTPELANIEVPFAEILNSSEDN